MESVTTRSRVATRRSVTPRQARRTCRITVCDCPVCRIMGSGRILSSFAVYQQVLAEQTRRPINLKIHLGRLPGICTSGPNITVNGQRVERVRPEAVRGIIRDLMTETSHNRSPVTGA